MRCVKYALSVLAIVLVTGCAHPIVISPDIAKIERDTGTQPIDRNVGYYIAPQNREMAVTTPGGGGDKVTYHPYREIETALYKMLSGVFKSVTVLKNANDAEVIGKKSISYVITPVIATSSYSPSIVTWPPTEFSVNLTCNISDGSGKLVATKSVIGNGKAEFDEFKSDFSLSAKRASLDALLKMQSALLNLPELRN